MTALSLHSTPEDAPFEFLLDMFLRAESLACFAGQSDEEEINGFMKEMAAGRLAPVDVQELFSKLRSDPAAVARLAVLLQESKGGDREDGE